MREGLLLPGNKREDKRLDVASLGRGDKVSSGRQWKPWGRRALLARPSECALSERKGGRGGGDGERHWLSAPGNFVPQK